MSTSDTPRTDSIAKTVFESPDFSSGSERCEALADFARQLERDNNRLRDDKERLLGLLGDVLVSYDAPIASAIRAELREESQP